MKTDKNTVIALMSFLLLAKNSSVKAVRRNISQYPVCINDEDCLIISDTEEDQFLCFQYMCFPWRREEISPFMPCRRGSDCRVLQTAEGGQEWDCWRHSDRRNVHTGICLEKRETVPCYYHSDCEDDLRCVVGHCGDPEYFRALAEMPCTEDDLCDDLGLGPECCLDIAGGVASLQRGERDGVWGKRCCDNIRSFVTVPRDRKSVV